jgi:hypothetical protein
MFWRHSSFSGSLRFSPTPLYLTLQPLTCRTTQDNFVMSRAGSGLDLTRRRIQTLFSAVKGVLFLFYSSLSLSSCDFLPLCGEGERKNCKNRLSSYQGEATSVLSELSSDAISVGDLRSRKNRSPLYTSWSQDGISFCIGAGDGKATSR